MTKDVLTDAIKKYVEDHNANFSEAVEVCNGIVYQGIDATSIV
jgi:hypothetical protein